MPLAFIDGTINIDARIAMMVMTTSSSVNLNREPYTGP